MGIRAGKVRPSQAVTQFGPGSLVDLPTLSMIIAGADEWNLQKALPVDEPRLARKLNVSLFRRPPFYSAKEGLGGVKARIFPRFLVCPRCNRLARHDAFEFDSKRKEHICKAPRCKGKGMSVAYPARFMVACPNGHLDDFPWHAYIHSDGVSCDAELRLEDSGTTGAITDLWVSCPTHPDAKRNLGQAFGRRNQQTLPACLGQRPWLGDVDPKGCGERFHVLLRGASNAYFPVVESAISIPPWSDPVQIAIGPFAEMMAKLESLDDMEQWRKWNNAPELDEFNSQQLWDALDRRRKGEDDIPGDLRIEEWLAFQSEPGTLDERAEFRSRSVAVPEESKGWVSRVVLLERLREVRALREFTRIDPIPDLGTMDDVRAMDIKLAPIMKNRDARWLPGIDFRGEGVLVQLDERALKEWESRPLVRSLWEQHVKAQVEWHKARDIEFQDPLPARYFLLHSLSHVLMRQLALDSGYSSTSLRERLYCSDRAGAEMAGILIYTATSDSDGSLGGLVEMGNPENLGPLFRRAVEGARLCANDPLCADRLPTGTGADLNGAACHACLLLSETACECGNHYLDRGVLVNTVANADTAFFPF